MAWTASNMSTAGVLALLNGNGATSGAVGPFYGASSTQNFHADTVNAALYGTNPTTATAVSDTLAHNAYAAVGGQWVAANESTATTGYTAGGVAVTPKTETFASNVVTFASTGTPNWTVTGTLTAFGALVYDNTVTSKYVFCWNYFGGSQSVTNGTFTVNWNASGIFTVTIS
jgi:hypothetical protein